MFKFTGNTLGLMCDSDLNQDHDINVLDVQLMVNVLLGGNSEGLCADLNNDTKVDTLDLEFLIQKTLGF